MRFTAHRLLAPVLPNASRGGCFHPNVTNRRRARRGTVLAIDPVSGTELWSTWLKGSSFVTLAELDRWVVAGTQGELSMLDRASGSILWHNKLKGMGLGLVSIAGAQLSPAAAALLAQQASDGAAAAAVAASG